MATANPTALLPHYRARSSSRKTLALYIPVLAALRTAASNTKNCIRRAAWGLSKRAMGLTRTAGSVSPPMRCRSSWVRSKAIPGRGTVKVSRSIKELGLKVTAERERLMKLTGAEPTVAQLAQNLGATPEQVAVSIQAAMPVVSPDPGG